MKRHLVFEELSKDHQQFLLLCWKIRQGIKKGIATERIEKYLTYSFHQILLPHFEYEENLVFTLLGEHHPFVSDALQEHEVLKELIESGFTDTNDLEKFCSILEIHIRREERQIYPEIERQAGSRKLTQLTVKKASVTSSFEDEFWV